MLCVERCVHSKHAVRDQTTLFVFLYPSTLTGSLTEREASVSASNCTAASTAVPLYNYTVFKLRPGDPGCSHSGQGTLGAHTQVRGPWVFTLSSSCLHSKYSFPLSHFPVPSPSMGSGRFHHVLLFIAKSRPHPADS